MDDIDAGMTETEAAALKRVLVDSDDDSTDLVDDARWAAWVERRLDPAGQPSDTVKRLGDEFDDAEKRCDELLRGRDEARGQAWAAIRLERKVSRAAHEVNLDREAVRVAKRYLDDGRDQYRDAALGYVNWRSPGLEPATVAEARSWLDDEKTRLDTVWAEADRRQIEARRRCVDAVKAHYEAEKRVGDAVFAWHEARIAYCTEKWASDLAVDRLSEREAS